MQNLPAPEHYGPHLRTVKSTATGDSEAPRWTSAKARCRGVLRLRANLAGCRQRARVRGYCRRLGAHLRA